MKKFALHLLIGALTAVSCKKQSAPEARAEVNTIVEVPENSPEPEVLLPFEEPIDLLSEAEVQKLSDTSFVNLKKLSDDFVYEILYATPNNFLKQQVYDCDECYLRLRTARDLIAANREFLQMGYRIKVFDCYRPHSVQKKMWDIMPGTNYVANPAKGSVHNRGGAVDVTLIDADGNELDMGTPFDFFGPEAHHDTHRVNAEVTKNRELLRSVLRKYNFSHITSEWWHYDHKGARQHPISDFRWDCD